MRSSGVADDAILDGQRHIWTIGDYSAVARRLRPVSVDLVETIGIEEGERVLDVGVGDGNTALEAARRGATITGIDLTPRQLERARERAAAEGVSLELQEGNAEELPFPDDSFDAVVSVFGVIFAPDHARATAELARVCRPGGRVAITSWFREGWFATWRARASELVPPPPPGGPDPDAWGDPDEAARRLRAVGLDVQVQVRPFTWSFPSVEGAADFLFENSGPYIAFRDAATAAGTGDRVRETLLAVLDESNQSTDGACEMAAPYVLAVGQRL